MILKTDGRQKKNVASGGAALAFRRGACGPQALLRNPSSDAVVESSADRRLLDRLRAGDARAFDDLVRLHADAVYRFAVRLTGRPDEAEDVAQETFARALRHASEFRREARFRTWLFRIAINIQRDTARRRAASPFAAPSDEAFLEPLALPAESDVSRRAEAREHAALVRTLVDRLPEMQREALILRVFEELPHAEIAEILGISVGAAKMNLLHARKKLSAWLGEGGDR